MAPFGIRLIAEYGDSAGLGRRVLRKTEPRLELFGGHGANYGHRRLAGAEEGDGRQGHYLEGLGDDGVGVDVHLHDVERGRVLLGDALQFGSDHPARTAPRRPEVDDDRPLRVEDNLFKRLVCNCFDFGHLGMVLST